MRPRVLFLAESPERPIVWLVIYHVIDPRQVVLIQWWPVKGRVNVALGYVKCKIPEIPVGPNAGQVVPIQSTIAIADEHVYGST